MRREGRACVGSDGGVVDFGDAGLYGSRSANRQHLAIAGIAASSDGYGCLLASSNGGISRF